MRDLGSDFKRPKMWSRMSNGRSDMIDQIYQNNHALQVACGILIM
jgi:hypothetical protein